MTKRLTSEQRSDLQHYAARLVKGGVSRRRMNTILRKYSLERFGIATSIGATAHSELFHKKMEAVKRQERGYRQKVRLVSPAKQKEKRYNKLISWHFLPWEAKAMTDSLNTLRYHEVSHMKAQRRGLFDRFLRIAASKGYDRNELPVRWDWFVMNWYMANAVKWQKRWERAMVKQRASLRRRLQRREIDRVDLLWKWYGHVKQQLPPEQQSETPKKHRRKKQDFVTRDKIAKSQRIANLQAQIERTHDPNLKAWLRGLIERERAR